MGKFYTTTIAAASLLVAACSSGPGVETDGTPGPKVIGRLQFDFDPNAAAASACRQFRWTNLAEKGTPDQVSSMLTTVLASAKLHGPGVWNPVTHILSATVRIQNLATFDFRRKLLDRRKSRG